MSIYVIFVLSSVGSKPGSRCPAMGVSTYSTIHNVGLMKLMGQNTVSILKGTKHLTRLLGLCPATVTDYANPVESLSNQADIQSSAPSFNVQALCQGAPASANESKTNPSDIFNQSVVC